jgi:hypothetical protein
MTRYTCRDCGHDYGANVPTPPHIVLHLTVSHGPHPSITAR